MKIFIISFLFVSPYIWANEESSQVLAHIKNTFTSDNYSLITKKVEFTNNRRDVFWNYEDSSTTAIDYGAQITTRSGHYQQYFNGEDVRLNLGRKWNKKLYTKFKIGVHIFDYAKEVKILPHELILQKKYTKFNISASYQYDFLYALKGITTPLTKYLTFKQIDLKTNYHPTKNWRIPLRISKANYSDDNQGSNITGSILYGRSYPVWIWVGFGAQNLQNKRSDTGYWSPTKFNSFGTQLECSKSVTDLWAVSIAYNKSTINEESYQSGESSLKSLKITYGNRNSLLFEISTYHIQSEQNNNEWWEKGTQAKLLYSF